MQQEPAGSVCFGRFDLQVICVPEPAAPGRKPCSEASQPDDVKGRAPAPSLYCPVSVLPRSQKCSKIKGACVILPPQQLSLSKRFKQTLLPFRVSLGREGRREHNWISFFLLMELRPLKELMHIFS